MLTIAVTVFVCVLVAASATGLQDSEIFRKGYKTSDAWKNKYAKDADGLLMPAPDNWYYRVFHLTYKEAFPLSATLFSALTDRWHLYKAMSVLSQRAAITILIAPVFGGGWIVLALVFAGLSLTWWSGFHATYAFIKQTK